MAMEIPQGSYNAPRDQMSPMLNSKGITPIAATPNVEGSAQGPNNPSAYTG